MLVSHSYRFIVFPEPLGACPWIESALQPWLDQQVASGRNTSLETNLFHGMTPLEAELAFDLMGHAFRTYTRIAIIQNPFTRLQSLYHRIAETDRVWQMRRKVGLRSPEFSTWLPSTRVDGPGAGHRKSPRWRRIGAWSAEHWCADHVSHTVRAEWAETELPLIFRKLGISPAFGVRHKPSLASVPDLHGYGAETIALVRARYQWDLGLYNGYDPELRLVA